MKNKLIVAAICLCASLFTCLGGVQAAVPTVFKYQNAAGVAFSF